MPQQQNPDEQDASRIPSRWPPEGELLDRLDKRLSRLVADLPLGPLEYLFAFPGMIFSTHTMVFLAPLTLSVLACRQELGRQELREQEGSTTTPCCSQRVLKILAHILVVAWCMVYVMYGLLTWATSTPYHAGNSSSSQQQPHRSLKIAKAGFSFFWCKQGYMVGPVLSGLILDFCISAFCLRGADHDRGTDWLWTALPLFGGSTNPKIQALHDSIALPGRRLILFWCTAIGITGPFKVTVRRRRPFICDLYGASQGEGQAAPETKSTSEDKVVHRDPKWIKFFAIFAKADATASFPSADTAASVGVALSVWLALSRGTSFISTIFFEPTALSIFCVACVFLAAFGRVFWRMHHVLDVLVGGAMAVQCCVYLEQMMAVQNLGCWTPVVGHLIFIIGSAANVLQAGRRGKKMLREAQPQDDEKDTSADVDEVKKKN
ncbi:unnamed protein product [Amoebophrya sp. A25]|nr:unnamed protein product [Amoebophrya sp. A25]|eukprot:GSA25T00019440001.1